MTATRVAPDTDAPAPELPAPRVRWQRFRAATVPPLVALLAGWALLACRSGLTDGRLFSPSTWARWDSGQYLRIARIGYFASYDCTSRQLPPHPPEGVVLLCGNAGWFPGYPAGTRRLSDLTHVPIPMMALIVAWTCWFLALVVMWQLLAGARSAPSRWLCLLIAAFFPGQVYFAALFPISLCVAGLLSCLYFATRDGPRPVLYGGIAALTGGYAAYSYITPIAAAPALLLTAVLTVRGRRFVQVAFAGLGIVAGFALVLLTFQLTVGIWNAYFLSAAKYGVGAHSPWETIGDRLEPLWTTQPAGREFLAVTASQTLLTLVLVVLVILTTLGWAAFHRRAAPAPAPVVVPDPDRGGATRVARRGGPYERFQAAFTTRLPARDLAVLLAAGGVWLVPYIAGGQASTYRSEAFVVLTVPLLRRLPPWLLAVVLAAAVLVAWRMAPYFYSGKLI